MAQTTLTYEQLYAEALAALGLNPAEAAETDDSLRRHPRATAARLINRALRRGVTLLHDEALGPLWTSRGPVAATAGPASGEFTRALETDDLRIVANSVRGSQSTVPFERRTRAFINRLRRGDAWLLRENHSGIYVVENQTLRVFVPAGTAALNLYYTAVTVPDVWTLGSNDDTALPVEDYCDEVLILLAAANVADAESQFERAAALRAQAKAAADEAHAQYIVSPHHADLG